MSSSALNLLIVDDEPLGARLLKSNLDRPGRIRCEVADSAAAALDRLAGAPFQAVLTDLSMPGMDGIELVRRIREIEAGIPIIVMTAHATLDRAVEAIRAGATDFLAKPLNVTAVLALVERAVAERPIREELAELQERRAAAGSGHLVIGNAPVLDRVRGRALQIAQAADSRVLITGESGTGKSLLARLIHDLSGAPGRFVEVNCAALPPHLLESELFGHEKGAFTDAKTMKRGLIEAAERGTILLDEIGTLPPELQAKLLLFLESRSIRRVGGVTDIPVRLRVIAATNEDLAQRVRDRAFRQDLYYRINVATLEMPALREMPESIPELAEHFTRVVCGELHRPVPPIDPECFADLVAYPWPGNARELRNAVERALIFHSGGSLVIHPPVLDSAPAGPPEGLILERGLSLDEVERRYLEYSLGDRPADLAGIASNLGISRKTLWQKRRRHGL